MEKEEYKEQLDVACQKFRKLMAEQLTRVEDMKAQGDFVDYAALDCIKIGVCGGDGIGPIISAQARRVLEFILADLVKAGKVAFKDIEGLTIENRIAKGKAIPDDVMAELKSCHIILKGPTTTPQKGSGMPNIESANVAMRKALDLFANIRPVKVPEEGINWTIFSIPACFILAAGSMFILWLGERITDKGIGNGISLIIMIGIIARLPQAFIQEVGSRFTAITSGGLVMFLVEIIILYAVVCASIILVQGVRKIPVQYAKRLVGNSQVGGARQYIPLKLFAANVMPIIFAQALMFIPLAFVQYAAPENASWFVRSLLNHHSWTYNIIFAVLIILFTYFYTAITLNPTQMAEDMKRNNGFIPGIKPGKPTADYIDTIMSRITFPGSLFIAFIAVMPALAGLLNVQDAFSQFFGGTSLLILVGVVIDTLQQIESHLLMKHYDGLLSSGRIHGRGGVAAY